MVRYLSDDGVFDGPVDKVWKLIQAHSDTNVTHIHSSFVRQATREERPGVFVAEIQMRGPDGKLAPLKLRMTPRPPHTNTIEFVEGLFAGSWSVHAYVPEGARTRVVTVGEFRIPGLDDASVLKAVDDFMEMGFAEDNAYLRKMA
jgi:hypothetical protein